MNFLAGIPPEILPAGEQPPRPPDPQAAAARPLTPYQLRMLIDHLAGPQSYIATGGKPIRYLLSHGLLSFNRRKTMTRITDRGRRRVANVIAQQRLARLPINLAQHP